MDVKPGYKPTEVGIIPEDWETRHVASIAIMVASGRSHVNSEFGDFPVYGSTGIIGHATQGEYSGKAILIARVGANAGKIQVVDGQYGVTDNTIIVRIDNSCNWEYFWRQLEAKRLNSMVFGSGQPLITGTQIKGLQIPCPPTATEQEAIVEAISDADTFIEALKQLIAKKRQIKQGAMQKLFTAKDHDETRPLGEISTLKGRIGWQGLKQSEFTSNEDEPFLITGMNFKDGAIRWNEVYHVSEDRYDMAKEIQLRKDDVLMTKDGTIGKVLFIDEIPYPGKASLNSHLLLFRPIRESYYPKYLYYQLSSRRFTDFIELSKSGSTFFGLSQAAVEKYPVLLPNREVQIATATTLSDMDEEVATLERKLTKAQQIKQGMMQELLTGRIRLI